MRKVKVVLPATVTNLGPGINSLALALGLHTTVEVIERGDESFTVETSGEGAGAYSVGLRHPVALGLARVFQQMERSPNGLAVRVSSEIPPASGLGSEAAFLVAGVVAANNLLGSPFNREQMISIAAQLCRRADHAVGAILGGLSASLLDGERVIYRALPIQSMPVAVVFPDLPDYPAHASLPDRVPMANAFYSLARLPLVTEAFRLNDLKLLAEALDDHLIAPTRRTAIPGWDSVVTAARTSGTSAISLCGDGPSLIAFAPTSADHRQIANAMVRAFAEASVKARGWVTQVDTQGVVISVAQS